MANIDPIAAMFNAAWFSEALHMVIAAFAATGFALADIPASLILRQKDLNFNLKGFKIYTSYIFSILDWYFGRSILYVFATFICTWRLQQ